MMKSERIIPRKQNSKQSHWIEAVENIENLVSFDRVKELEREAVEWLKQSTKGKKVAYGWSGGKDSQVLRYICEKAGITDAVLVTTELEYTDFYDFVEEHAPKGLTTLYRGFDWEYIKKNPKYLFPKDTKLIEKYWAKIQRVGCRDYYFNNDIEQMIIGRRKADGNYCPKRIYSVKSGYTQNLPLMDWTHEEMLAYIHYYNVPLPKIYEYDDGYFEGSGCFTKLARNDERKTIADCWAYIYKHDKEAVYRASKHLTSAKNYLIKIGEIIT